MIVSVPFITIIPESSFEYVADCGSLGQLYRRIAAPCVFDGPIDGGSFRAYVEQCVVPILRQDDIVMMDNLPSHKVAVAPIAA